MLEEIGKEKKRDRETRNYHAGIKLITQILYVMRDMLKSPDPKNQRNGKILQQNVFYHDMIRLSRQGFNFYIEGLHHKAYLYDLLEFTYIVFFQVLTKNR